MTTASSPLFIAFEGGDGTGKSTQATRLAQHLLAAGREVELTFEPGDTALGAALREAVLHGEPMDARTEALLYAADRAHHVHTVIRPALAQGKIVITDRYIDSSLAYQGVGRGLGEGAIADLSRWATDGLLPDLTIVLDVDVDTARRRRRGEPDRLEREAAAFHERVRQAFLRLAEAAPQRYLVVDAARDPQTVAAAISRRVGELLEGRA